MRTLAVFIVALVTACSGQDAGGTYAGAVRPVNGDCDPASQAELTLHGAAVLFAPASATLVLRGRKAGTTLTATETLLGADRKNYRLVFNGAIAARSIVGTYQTPRCRYSVSLHKTAD